MTRSFVVFCIFSILPAIGGLSLSIQPRRTCTQLRSVQSSITTVANPLLETFDYHSEDKIPWLEQGYQFWRWNGNDIHYLEMGDKSKPAILLIHGFGASAYHFRYNIPKLAQDYHVYAFDLLGFGLSSKPIQEYSAHVWKDQTVDFIREIIKKPVVIAGNSLGGFTALFASAYAGSKFVKGCILLNAAGRFRGDVENDYNEKSEDSIVTKITDKIKEVVQRLVIGASFIYTKQPARIQQVLRQVYPVNPSMVDDELVQSIQYPSFHPNAAEVFYRVIVKNGNGPDVYVEDLLNQLQCPVLLCWGLQDPWIRPLAADKIESLYNSKCYRVNINAGHCPHDEAPDEVNTAIRDFTRTVLS